ncbi:MAG: 2'-5' RNA ligase family protein [Rubrobacter sp.]
MTEIPPLILTLKLDVGSQSFFDSMRERHFPPERNFIAAHVTLFHALQGFLLEDISSDVAKVCRDHSRFPVRVRKLRSLGGGVAYVLASDELSGVRSDLVREWKSFLGAQDKQKFSPHVTVQNKVKPEQARQLFAELEPSFEPFEVTAEGLLLWRYMGGPWKFERGFDLGSA